MRLHELYFDFARQDREVAINLGGKVEGLLIVLLLPHIDMPALIDLAVWFATLAAHNARSSQSWEQKAQEARGEISLDRTLGAQSNEGAL